MSRTGSFRKERNEAFQLFIWPVAERHEVQPPRTDGSSSLSSEDLRKPAPAFPSPPRGTAVPGRERPTHSRSPRRPANPSAPQPRGRASSGRERPRPAGGAPSSYPGTAAARGRGGRGGRGAAPSSFPRRAASGAGARAAGPGGGWSARRGRDPRAAARRLERGGEPGPATRRPRPRDARCVRRVSSAAGRCDLYSSGRRGHGPGARSEEPSVTIGPGGGVAETVRMSPSLSEHLDAGGMRKCPPG